MGNDPSEFTGCNNCPVENVSWDDVQVIIKKLNAQTGKKYRLPTEAEWEFAAREGIKNHYYKYSGSDDINEVAEYDGNNYSRPNIVGNRKPNRLGIYDMSGNVSEYCSDWIGTDNLSPQKNPQGPLNGEYHRIRGGNFVSRDIGCRVYDREKGTFGCYCYDGFRLAMSIK